MKGPDTISMCGEKMTILIGGSCLAGRRAPDASKLPALVSNLCSSLSLRNVARHFIRKVRIGDIVALVDKRIGYTYRFKVETNSILILSISKQPPKVESNKMPVLFLVNSRLFQAIPSNKVVAA